MQRAVKEALGTTTFEPTGTFGGGSISCGASYLTDTGQVFVKWNSGSNALQMFEGEKEGLLSILATKTIQCPKPICVVSLNDKTGSGSGAALIMSNIFMKPLNSSFQQSLLGERLARLHLNNSIQIRKFGVSESRVTGDGNSSMSEDEDESNSIKPIFQYGYHVPTSCGYHSLDNTWCDHWDEFYIRQRLLPLVETLITSYSDRELIYTWPVAASRIESILRPVNNCKPALLHGDLWSGNVGSADGEPVIFDPGVFYGHSEFEFGIGTMFGGFSHHFFDSYHKVIPAARGWEQRRKVYELFHHLNHWNHFGGSYRDTSMKLMKKIAKGDPDDHHT